MVGEGNRHNYSRVRHNGRGVRHNGGGVRHIGGGIQHIGAIDEKKDESKPPASLHKLIVSSPYSYKQIHHLRLPHVRSDRIRTAMSFDLLPKRSLVLEPCQYQVQLWNYTVHCLIQCNGHQVKRSQILDLLIDGS
ncbi:hypothetical protein RDI58_011065 [Solanum bulbocastanum]|uniref:Uncharacterized protein n=1 Tax=Solanum bulbocastanum TaxID=147425 RepID=A0AAN8TQL4_SOLBU